MIRKIREMLNKINESPNKDKQIIEYIPNDIEKIQEILNDLFENCADFVLRQVTLANNIKAIIAFMDGISNKQIINENILKRLMCIETERFCIDNINESIVNISQFKKTESFQETINAILSGDTVLYIDGYKVAILYDTKTWEARAVEQPDTESSVRGPRDSFTETLSTNISLIRRRIKSTNLKFEVMKIGRESKTDVCIVYIDKIVDNDILSTLKRRLSKIDTDAILDSGYIEQYIEDGPSSLFPTVGNSERPDKVVSKLLEGRVAIICDGSPFVLTVPYLFIESIHSSEDYYSKPFFSSYIRFIRALALVITILLPAVYVAVTSFHINIVPIELIISMASSAEGIPFSPFVESFIMMIVFEILREAGIRMPRPVGQAVSIVGALVIGESAVNAGFVSSSMVIIVSLTAISSFIVPSMNDVVAILRLVFLVSANILGLLGIFLTFMLVILHLCSLRSFGVPYLYPYSPLNIIDMKDGLIRVPIWMMLTRPNIFSKKNKFRMNTNIRKKED
ncbi:spore germination protein KA [Alkalithermobacter thermoalcaliphilus JW-YL-7 = DSM 7308]|uniref:GerA spore germination protein n=1 Tax=Alkalithermobacter thermoalcaliphilus JW-YL-7 = DSM 7308 TaxID=1121328 RepID=A0A150FSR6_CLOPD|nr:GerA spore germination protein [[Clostridium] paradoxum JW-YL-7 = DSM 7308]SHL18221.1 spore germination protein KA [[Clostridium] paradoxum JW-YL-7 = DSM 7308]